MINALLGANLVMYVLGVEVHFSLFVVNSFRLHMQFFWNESGVLCGTLHVIII